MEARYEIKLNTPPAEQQTLTFAVEVVLSEPIDEAYQHAIGQRIIDLVHHALGDDAFLGHVLPEDDESEVSTCMLSVQLIDSRTNDQLPIADISPPYRLLTGYLLRTIGAQQGRFPVTEEMREAMKLPILNGASYVALSYDAHGWAASTIY